MRNIRITIEYDGKNFPGWQSQPGKMSIQSEIQKAIFEVTGEEVDVIICNPPYFKTDENNKSNDKYLNLAKHESEFTLEGMIKTAYKNLKLNGKFYMLFTSQRLSEVFLLLNKYH